VAAAFAGTTGVGLRRFLVGGAATAAVWAGAWIGVGYLIGRATRDGDLPGTVCLAVALVLSAAATLGLAIPAAVRAIAAMCYRSPAATASRRETPPGGTR
jgi:membrane protein DedA with SNARE-associated domain